MRIPSRIHFVGVGGIGMSGLAQMLKWLGCDVSGSDRDMDKPENSRIIDSLRNCGIRLFPQDGSFISEGKTDAMIYSTAIENDNPDFKAGADIPKIHRAAALSSAIISMKDVTSVAVTGTCGKTTVTSWLAETLVKMGHDPAMLSGGLVNNFSSAKFAGNFRPGKGRFFIYEADESDKSLLAFNPDYSLILNIGNDHYPINELTEVFRKFIGSTSKGAILEESVAEYVGTLDGSKIKYLVFGSGEKCGWRLLSYKTENKIPMAMIENKSSDKRINLALPSPGLHMAMNAVSVLATLDILGLYSPDCHKYISSFGGVWRRFNIKGNLPSGALIIDDYAHNPEKIGSCIRTAKEITAGRIFAVFQPHGFGPLKFMKDNLFKELEKIISKEDKFILLPVFYAGGTTSFSPTSEEVVSEFDSRGGNNFMFFKTRDHLEKYLKAETCANDTVVILGARDNSLSTWTEEIASS